MKALLKHLDGIAWSNPEIMSGTIVFVGTRVPAVTLLDYLAGGESLDRFLLDFPGVSREQAEALLTGVACAISPEMYEVAAS